MHNLVLEQKFKFRPQRSWPGTVVEMTDQRIATFEAKDLDSNDTGRQFVSDIAAKYRKNIAARRRHLDELPSGPIHGDIMWDNMKFANGRIAGIFDFDDCRTSYFVEDIAKTLFFKFESPQHCLFGRDGKNVEVFIMAYNSVRNLTEGEKRIIPLLFVTRFLYQVLGYYDKLEGGQHQYLAKIDNLIARYKQHQTYFSRPRTLLP